MAASDADTEAALPRWSSGAPLLKQLNVNTTFSMCADIVVFCTFEIILHSNGSLRQQCIHHHTIVFDCSPIYL